MNFCSIPARRALAAGLCLILSISPAGLTPGLAQNLPNLGDESETVLSPQMERRIGESYFRELRRDFTYLDDPELKAYVEQLGAQLIAAGPDSGLVRRKNAWQHGLCGACQRCIFAGAGFLHHQLRA